MCAFCPGRLRRRNDRGRFNTSSPFDASVNVTDARGRVRNPDKPSRASGGLMKPPARALSRYRPIRVVMFLAPAGHGSGLRPASINIAQVIRRRPPGGLGEKHVDIPLLVDRLLWWAIRHLRLSFAVLEAEERAAAAESASRELVPRSSEGRIT